jgi:hypothetical protein
MATGGIFQALIKSIQTAPQQPKSAPSPATPTAAPSALRGPTAPGGTPPQIASPPPQIQPPAAASPMPLDMGLAELIAAFQAQQGAGATPAPTPAAPLEPPAAAPLTPAATLSPEVSAFGQWLQQLLGRGSGGGAGYGGGAAPAFNFHFGGGGGGAGAGASPSALLGPAFYQTQRSGGTPRALPSGASSGFGGGSPAFPSLTGPGGGQAMTPSPAGQGYLPSPTRLV